MKKSILILILAGLLTSCTPVENSQESSEIQTAQTVTEASESEDNSESELYSESETQESTECEISTTEATVTTAEIQSETVCTTTAATDVQKEKSQYDPTESQQEKADESSTDHTESSTEIISEESTESTQSEPPQTAETTGVTVTESTEYEEETEFPEYDMSDYEKAAEIYEYMTVNGGGTCVQYAYQTYEMCCQYGLECYFAWTENQLYGHVANVVRIDGIWYVLDTQAGCFLTENMCGFTEIVDANESYIASADIISSVRYE